MSSTNKGDPIPAKFDPPEENLIRDLARKTGLTVSEVIRRAARLLRIEIEKRGDDWHAFLIRDLGPDAKTTGGEVSYSLKLARKKTRQASRPKKSAA